MTYPAFPQLSTSDIEYSSGVQLDRTENGVVRGSVGYDERAVRLRLEHFLSAADLTTLRAYEASNRGQPDSVVYDGDPESITLSMIIVRLHYRWHASGKYFVTVDLEGNET